jgi:hypothetical protein
LFDEIPAFKPETEVGPGAPPPKFYVITAKLNRRHCLPRHLAAR